MDKYIEIKNARNNVIIDDQYKVAKFVYRGKITTNNVVFKGGITDGKTFKYRSGERLATFEELELLGFLSSDKSAYINKFMLFCRSRSGVPFRAWLRVMEYSGENRGLFIEAGCDLPSIDIEYCLYTLADMKPCSFGAQAFNSKGELVFDAMRGYLQVVGSMYGGVNVQNNPAAIYEIAIPEGLNMDNVFISHRSALPYYAAYKIGGSGVSYAQTYFYPVMSFKNSTTLVVKLEQQNPVGGNNSATAYNAYYENVIYCPYPSGVWITGD